MFYPNFFTFWNVKMVISPLAKVVHELLQNRQGPNNVVEYYFGTEIKHNLSSAKIGIVLVSAMLLASLTVTGVLIGYYDLIPTVVGVVFGNAYTPESLQIPGIDPRAFENNYLTAVYFKPYCRIVPYLVGILLGYVMQKQTTRRKHMSKTLVILGWTLSTAIGLAIVYGTYWSFQTRWSTAVNVLYGTFSKLGWSLALGWVIYACKNGYGGWINDFLSWSFWVPLSRLTYAVYLLQGIVIQMFYFNLTTTIHIDLFICSYYFCGFLLVSYGGALFLSLAIEYPCVNLEKLLTSSNSSNISGSRRREVNSVSSTPSHIKDNSIEP